MISVINLYKKHIKGTTKGDLAPTKEACVCKISTDLAKKLELKSNKVFITARALKHIYERIFLTSNKPEDFSLVLQRMPKVVSASDKICNNKTGKKKGNYCFFQSFNDRTYICVTEVRNGLLYVTTSFIPKEDYLKGFGEPLVL